jgi:hypothetical protein
MKDFKDKLIGGTFAIVLIYFFGYLIYNYFSLSGLESNYLFYSFVALFIYIMIIAISTIEKEQPEKESIAYNIFTLNTKVKINFIYMYIALIFSIPILTFVFGICLTLINNIYFLLALYFMITLFLFLITSNKTLPKLITILTLGVALYFGYKARNIFKLNVIAVYDHEVIYKN